MKARVDTITPFPLQCNLQLYIYILLVLLTTCFGPNRPSSGVTSHAKTVALYRMILMFGALFTSYTAVSPH
jgi:hypothetical protein